MNLKSLIALRKKLWAKQDATRKDLKKLRAHARRTAKAIDRKEKRLKARHDRINKLSKRIKRKKHHQHHHHVGGGPDVMFDAVDTSALPHDAKAVGAYVGPSIFTVDKAKAQCPNARIVRISQAGLSSTPADVVDVEPGDATNSTGVAWLKRKLAGEALGGDAGRVPKVYTSASNVQAFINAADAAGIHRSEYRLWSAHYSTPHVCGPSTCGYPQADGTQHTDHSGGHSLDESKLLPAFWD